jgi:hypothetical protein
MTADGHKIYLEAVEHAFGREVAQLAKIYVQKFESEKRYGPPSASDGKTT